MFDRVKIKIIKSFFSILILSVLASFLNCKERESNIVKSQNNAQDSIKIIEDELVYNFINNVLDKNDIYKECENLLDRSPIIFINGDSLLTAKIDTLFSNKDLEFIQKQYKNGDRFVLDKNKINNKNIIEIDTTLNYREEIDNYWEDIYAKYDCVSSIRVPLFNQEKNIVIIELEYTCGMLCGEKGIFIYKKNKEGKWELYLTLEKLVS